MNAAHSFQINGHSPERNTMKKQDIRNIYTQKVAELLNQGYTIFPDTMSGSQGEIAHIDLTNGFEILRVLLERELFWNDSDEGFHGDVVTLTIGKAAVDTWVGDRWDGLLWNNRLESRFQIRWAEIKGNREGWYTDLDEAARIWHIRRERYRRNGISRSEELSTAFKSAALRWLQKQPRMKRRKLEDIEKMERIWDERGHRSFQITVKGKRYTFG